MTTDPIAAARALIAAQPALLFRCDLCSDEGNCHPHHDMSMSGEYILCDECEDFDAAATPPDPLKLIATLADALEAERAKVAAAYEAAADAASCCLGCQDDVRALTSADAQAALDKLLAAARLEGWRAGLDAAADCADDRTPAKHGGTPLVAHVTAKSISNAIRALPEPKENSHD